MKLALKPFLVDWIFKPRGIETGPVVLGQRRIFILPTREGLMFAVTLALMLIGSINYNLSLGFILTFLLAAMAIVSILHTFRNVLGLRVRAGKTQPVFAGETAKFTICIENTSALARYGIGLKRAAGEPVYCDAAPLKTACAILEVAETRRGVLRLGRFTLYSRFPLGLFHAWSNLDLDTYCLVYPRPDAHKLPPPASSPESNQGIEAGRGSDDFFGVRPYHPGDSLRHVDWKAAARGHELLTKQFSGHAQARLAFEWDALPATMAVEAKLSRLARWVVDADAAGQCYSLKLPGAEIPPGAGERQREKCLEALALYAEPAP